MNQNFKNKLLRLKYQFKMNPDGVVLLITIVLGYLVGLYSQSITFQLFFLLYLFVLFIIKLPKVSSWLFYKRIGDSKFFVTRQYPFCNWRGIYQLPDKKALQAMSEHERRKAMISQKDSLMDALPEGHYRTLTHDTIAERIKSYPQVCGYCCIPAYKADLKALQKNILRGDKTLREWAERERQFYFIDFIKKMK